MALLNLATQVSAQIPSLLETLRAGQAPDKFTREFLRDIGFKSSNHHAFIPLLKGLGFLTPDGAPTDRYKSFLDPTKWKAIVAEAVREAYGDIFILKSKPNNSDLKLIAGKYKSTYNMSETTAERAARTFLALLEVADQEVLYSTANQPTPISTVAPSSTQSVTATSPKAGLDVGLHYNIQIHLPATKDVEVYNAIFKSLREHLVD
jgi:Family of unknown function (DUF5343)